MVGSSARLFLNISSDLLYVRSAISYLGVDSVAKLLREVHNGVIDVSNVRCTKRQNATVEMNIAYAQTAYDIRTMPTIAMPLATIAVGKNKQNDQKVAQKRSEAVEKAIKNWTKK